MTTGTMHSGGAVTAGAARLGVCPAANPVSTVITAAPAYATPWLDGVVGKQDSHRFTTDRATRRPLECFP
jgi:hypothetical protein